MELDKPVAVHILLGTLGSVVTTLLILSSCELMSDLSSDRLSLLGVTEWDLAG